MMPAPTLSVPPSNPNALQNVVATGGESFDSDPIFLVCGSFSRGQRAMFPAESLSFLYRKASLRNVFGSDVAA
jgi:hypothetical protein